MDGHGFKPWSSINACEHICKYVDPKSSATILTSTQSADVTIEINPRITQTRKHARGLTWFWNPGQTSPEVQNRVINDPIKRTYVLQIFFKKYLGIFQNIDWINCNIQHFQAVFSSNYQVDAFVGSKAVVTNSLWLFSKQTSAQSVVTVHFIMNIAYQTVDLFSWQNFIEIKC